MDVDPIEFGKLIADVANTKEQIRLLREEVQPLVTAVNKGKGALAVLLVVSSAIGAAAAEVMRWTFHQH